jgi:membrane protease YdiL (CAAX protease family)
MVKPLLLLKIALSVFFFLVLVLQLFSFPGQFRYMAEQEPENAHLRWPLTVLFVLIFLAVEILIVTVWKVASSLGISSQRAVLLKYVNLSIGALIFIWLVIASALLWLLLHADDPGLPLVITVIEVGVSVLGLLFIIYRNHLAKSLPSTPS